MAGIQDLVGQLGEQARPEVFRLLQRRSPYIYNTNANAIKNTRVTLSRAIKGILMVDKKTEMLGG
eukprot:9412817-Karenia_brevis.AAC.1